MIRYKVKHKTSQRETLAEETNSSGFLVKQPPRNCNCDIGLTCKKRVHGVLYIYNQTEKNLFRFRNLRLFFSNIRSMYAVFQKFELKYV